MQNNALRQICNRHFFAGCTGMQKNNFLLKKPSSLEDAMAYVNLKDFTVTLPAQKKINKPPVNTPRQT